MTHRKTDTEAKMALYTSPLCGFSWRVTRAIKRLGLDVEMRNVLMHPAYRDELIQVRGRSTVPVLWIQSPDGAVRWLPESQDIIHYLEHTHGRR